jgi:hypothetical protein
MGLRILSLKLMLLKMGSYVETIQHLPQLKYAACKLSQVSAVKICAVLRKFEKAERKNTEVQKCVICQSSFLSPKQFFTPCIKKSVDF